MRSPPGRRATLDAATNAATRLDPRVRDTSRRARRGTTRTASRPITSAMREGVSRARTSEPPAPELVDAGDQQRDRERIDCDGSREPRSASTGATQLLDDGCGEDATGRQRCGHHTTEEADGQCEQRGCGDGGVGAGGHRPARDEHVGGVGRGEPHRHRDDQEQERLSEAEHEGRASAHAAQLRERHLPRSLLTRGGDDEEEREPRKEHEGRGDGERMLPRRRRVRGRVRRGTPAGCWTPPSGARCRPTQG